MSFRCLGWAQSQNPGNATAKMLLLALAEGADDDGLLWWGQKRLAERCNTAERTIRTHLAALEREGYLKREPRYRQDGGRSSDNITLQLARPPSKLRLDPPANLAAAPGNPDRSPPANLAGQESVILESVTEPKPSARLNGERLELETRFARFWQAYPRKVAKPAALRAWTKLTPDDAQLEDMLADVLDRCRSPDWLKDNGAYIPYPATYLNQKRWEDCVTDLKGKPP